MWLVTAEKVEEDEEGVITSTGNISKYLCKYVAIATGHHAKPAMPTYSGQDKFQGTCDGEQFLLNQDVFHEVNILFV